MFTKSIAFTLVMFSLLIGTTTHAQYVYFDQPSDLIYPSGNSTMSYGITMEARIMLPAALSGSILFREITCCNEDKIMFCGDTNIGGYVYPSNGSYGWLQVPVSMSLNTWHHIAYVYDGSQQRAYLDGVMVGSLPCFGYIGNGNGESYLGSGFVGYIDTFRLSTIARYSGNSFTPPQGDLTTDANTSILYNFNEPLGSTIVLDLSGNGRDGTFGNSPSAPEIVNSVTGWTVLNKPGATGTCAYSSDGENIVGYYEDGTGNHGFLYNGLSWTSLNVPGGNNTAAHDIDGLNIVGDFRDSNGRSHGFFFNGSTWTTLDPPGGALPLPTYAAGIDGVNIVGVYGDVSGRTHGFLYNTESSTWTTLNKPGAIDTYAEDISGNNIVGFFDDSTGYRHGFYYNGTTWTTLNAPGGHNTEIFSIDGYNMVGRYWDNFSYAHGFLYDGSTWTTLDVPGADHTEPLGIHGNTITGTYYDVSGSHGFIYVLPPRLLATVKLLGWSGNLNTLPILVSVDGGTATSVTLTGTGDTGTFTLNLPSTGSHTVRVKAATYLAQKLTIDEGQVSASFNLSPGDVTNDNKIDDLDFLRIIACFGSHDPVLMPLGDCNGDGVTDDLDFLIVIGKFGTQGDN